jgi:hypothetical protein
VQCQETLGERDARTRPGSLEQGEKQAFAAGAFFVTPEPFQLLVGHPSRSA